MEKKGKGGLKISAGLSLPISAATEKLAWIGTTGSGKTYGASKFAEELWRVGAQFVVLDPVGVWYGLRLQKDGKKPSAIDIPIFGGLHGDVPLEATGGALIADLVVDNNLSCIIDVSQFESDADKARFATAFGDRLFFRKKSAPSAMHLFIEECQEFVPQNPQKGEERMLHAYTRMQKLGRNFGIGASYISQRPQDVNKKALNMTQTLFVFRTTGSQERKAIETWIADKSLDQDLANDLPKIETGNCHVWSPAFLKISEMVHISEKSTYNASATPEVGAAAKARKLAPIDLKKLAEEMKDTIERSKADDPAELKKRIKELEKGKAPVVVETPAMGVSQWANYGKERGYWDYFMKQADKAFEQERAQYRGAMTKISMNLTKIAELAQQPVLAGKLAAETLQIPVPAPTPSPVSKAVKETTERMAAPAAVDYVLGAKKWGPGERATLGAIAQQIEGITREHLTVITGYKRATRNTYIQRLAQAGLVRVQGDLILITQPGVEELGTDYKPLPASGPELLAHVLEKLPPGEAKILQALIDNPAGLTRDELTELTTFTRATRNTYIQRLGARALVKVEGNTVRAADTLL